MTEKEEAEAYAGDVTPEAAFKESESHRVDGLDLQPYSPARMWAADAMNLHYGRIDEAGMAMFNKEYIYPGAVADVGIILWLCSVKDDLRIDKARRDPLTACIDAAKWAQENGIANSRSKKFWPAYTTFLRIMQEVQVSTGETEKKTETEASQTPPSSDQADGPSM